MKKVLLISLLLSIQSCDKFEELKLSQSNFELDASSHNLEVETSGVFISSISVNGISREVEFVEQRYYGIAPPVYECDDYRIIYDKNGEFVEVDGIWFNIKLKDNDRNVAIIIDKNTTTEDRHLNITLSGDYISSKDITIKQSKE